MRRCRGTMSWCTTCRVELLTTDNISHRRAAVHKVLRSTALQIPTNSHSKLELDMLRNIQPMELAAEQMCQAAVELTSSAKCPSCCIQHSLNTISSVAFDNRPARWCSCQHGMKWKRVPMSLQTQCQANDEFFESQETSKCTMNLCLKRACRC